MTLTFVVPTIPGRESLLSRCLWSLTSQQATVLVVDGTARLGDKVVWAASTVETDYMTVVDDDDYVTPDYLAHVGPHLGKVDYVGFRFLELMDGAYYGESSSFADYEAWGSRSRGPVPKGVTRTGLFRQVRFGNDYRADRRWSAQMREHIRSHAFVDRPLYVHDWWPTQSAFSQSPVPRDVGTWPHAEVDRVTFDRPGV